MSESYAMRSTCQCGSTDGHIVERNGQDCVFCSCGRFQYNAPRVETGRAVRSVATRENITPKRRFRILESFGHRCVACGATGTDLTIDHLVSRADAAKHGFLDEIIDSDDNLAPMCAACNLGKGPSSASAILTYRCLLIRRRSEGRSA